MPEPDINKLPPHVRAALTSPITPTPADDAKTHDERKLRLQGVFRQRLQDACDDWHESNSWIHMPDHIKRDLADRIRTQLLDEIHAGQHD